MSSMRMVIAELRWNGMPAIRPSLTVMGAVVKLLGRGARISRTLDHSPPKAGNRLESSLPA